MLGMKIKAKREEKGWSIYKLAKEAEITEQCISHIETGKRKDPYISTVIKISKALGITVAELIGE